MHVRIDRRLAASINPLPRLTRHGPWHKGAKTVVFGKRGTHITVPLLAAAASKGLADVVERLIGAGHRADGWGKAERYVAFHGALNYNNTLYPKPDPCAVKIVRALADLGLNPFECILEGYMSPFLVACSHGVILFELPHIHQNNVCIEHTSPLHHAAAANAPCLAEWLCGHGLDMDVQSWEGLRDWEGFCGGYTPLEWAADGNHMDVVRVLVRAGATLPGDLHRSTLAFGPVPFYPCLKPRPWSRLIHPNAQPATRRLVRAFYMCIFRAHSAYNRVSL